MILRSARPANALALHQSLHLIAAYVETGVLGRAGELAASVDGVVLAPQGLELRTDLGVTS
jgi:hypothetical protein